MMTYFLSLGSNINAIENLDFAQSELNKILINTKSSSIHKTKAEGFEGDDFLNSVICGETKDSFDELNYKLKSIEDAAGRNRSAPKFSARTLDIDIVLQIDEDEEILFESDEIEKYTFVSEPLKELLK
ncbi:MAG: 2-amino-4-hydroxy-6-hydroxymethyldihydropteridine diphosphokinase [Gammaproteobacteria bacterium]|jgi:2-amino-4-hydroxy-6-hydroxymethyldihydropteridine diphosphokinase